MGDAGGGEAGEAEGGEVSGGVSGRGVHRKHNLLVGVDESTVLAGEYRVAGRVRKVQTTKKWGAGAKMLRNTAIQPRANRKMAA